MRFWNIPSKRADVSWALILIFFPDYVSRRSSIFRKSTFLLNLRCRPWKIFRQRVHRQRKTGSVGYTFIFRHLLDSLKLLFLWPFSLLRPLPFLLWLVSSRTEKWWVPPTPRWIDLFRKHILTFLIRQNSLISNPNSKLISKLRSLVNRCLSTSLTQHVFLPWLLLFTFFKSFLAFEQILLVQLKRQFFLVRRHVKWVLKHHVSFVSCDLGLWFVGGEFEVDLVLADHAFVGGGVGVGGFGAEFSGGAGEFDVWNEAVFCVENVFVFVSVEIWGLFFGFNLLNYSFRLRLIQLRSLHSPSPLPDFKQPNYNPMKLYQNNRHHNIDHTHSRYQR